jgi:branched-chain amino acid transport system ATP-binding protein
VMKQPDGGNGRPPALAAIGISAGYGEVAILRELDLQVGAGEIVALLGANGAGKTTTMLTLAGHLPARKGAVHINGTAAPTSAHARARLGLAFLTEESAVFKTLSVDENLRVGRGNLDKALRLVPELRPLLKKKVGLLSGGEQQLVALARALSGEPKVLMIDELSMGLAPKIVDRLLDAVCAAAEDGVGVLVVEQYAERILAVAHRAYVMRSGRIEMTGASAAIRENLKEVRDIYLSSRD